MGAGTVRKVAASVDAAGAGATGQGPEGGAGGQGKSASTSATTSASALATASVSVPVSASISAWTLETGLAAAQAASCTTSPVIGPAQAAKKVDLTIINMGAT